MTKPINTEPRGPGRLRRLLESMRRAVAIPTDTEPTTMSPRTQPMTTPIHTAGGFREPFVEVPADRLRPPDPVTARELRRQALQNALRMALDRLTETSDVDNVEKFRETLVGVSGLLSDEDYYPDERIRDVRRTVDHLGWLMERRIEQLRVLRCNVGKLCSRRLSERIFGESAEAPFRRPDAKEPPDAPSCSGDEHVYEPGEPRCDCGKVAMRAR